MGLLALGINHKTASLALREKVAFTPERLAEALRDACADAGIAELAILSTCNRTEFYGLAPAAGA
ncbi:MAG: glutamyl-tRNA reductase, partial [Moraxellaceae bacterium]